MLRVQAGTGKHTTRETLPALLPKQLRSAVWLFANGGVIED